jgi:hypothetical protein
MKPKTLERALISIAKNADWYLFEEETEYAAHELAHAIVIGHGVARRDFEREIDAMAAHHQDRHEYVVTALEIAALATFGFKLSWNKAARNVLEALRVVGRPIDDDVPARTARRLRLQAVKRRLKATPVSARNVKAFRRYVMHAVKAMPR